MSVRYISQEAALEAFLILEGIAEQAYEQETNGALVIHSDALIEINEWYLNLLESENEDR